MICTFGFSKALHSATVISIKTYLEALLKYGNVI